MKTQKTDFNVLNIADIHFGKKNDQKLYDDLKENFIEEIPKIISEYDHLNMVIIEGDLFDRVIKLTELASNLALKFVHEMCELSAKYNFYFRIVKGTSSHDNSMLNNFNHLEIKYPLFKMIKTVNTETIKNYKILYVPEEYPEDYKKYYKDYLNDNYDFIFGHGMIDFVAYTGEVKVKRNEAVHAAATLDKICKYFCIFGHIHDFKNYNDEDKIMYTGSFERFSFADQEDKGYLLTRVNSKTNESEVLFYENPNASVYKVLNISSYNFNSTEEKLNFINEEKKTCDYLKVIIDKEEDNKELLKNIMASDIKVESHNKIPEEVADERFNFLIKKELPRDQSISKYIDITKGKKIASSRVSEFLSVAESL